MPIRLSKSASDALAAGRKPPESEAEFQRCVIQCAQIHGWQVAHFGVARTKNGWATPVRADGKGFTDLVLVRERVIFIECKTEKGRLTPEQSRWIEKLKAARQEVYVFRPSDWPKIERILLCHGSTPSS